MTELEMIKAFAELEGLELTYICAEGLLGEVKPACYVYQPVTSLCELIEYNPITDYALTFKAMVDYGVDVQNCTEFDYWLDGSGSFDIPYICASIKDPEGAHAVTELGDVSIESTAKSIIECILKSKGLWQ